MGANEKLRAALGPVDATELRPKLWWQYVGDMAHMTDHPQLRFGFKEDCIFPDGPWNLRDGYNSKAIVKQWITLNVPDSDHPFPNVTNTGIYTGWQEVWAAKIFRYFIRGTGADTDKGFVPHTICVETGEFLVGEWWQCEEPEPFTDAEPDDMLIAIILSDDENTKG